MNGIVIKEQEFNDKVINELSKMQAHSGGSSSFSSLSASLSSSLPSDFAYIGQVNAISQELNSMNGYLAELQSKLQARLNEVSQIEDKHRGLFDRFWSGLKKTFASVVNFGVSVIKGAGKFLEAVVDTAAIVVSTTVLTPVALIADAVEGNGLSNTKNVWQGTKAAVSTNVVSGIADKFYSTEAGKWLDSNAAGWFKSDGIACTIGEGLGYAVPIIATGGFIGASMGAASAAAAGLTGAAATAAAATVSASVVPTAMGITAAVAGFGKYTAEEWNKNSISIAGANGTEKITMNYEKMSEIQQLSSGESTTITQNGETYTITATGDGNYKLVDSSGQNLTVESLNESNTAKGLVVGAVKGAWEGAQYYVGGKINQFTKININGIDKKVHAGVRVAMDATTGAAEVPFQSAVSAIAEGTTFKEAWDTQGGWKAVGTQTLLAGGMSAGAEGLQAASPTLRRIFRGEDTTSVKLDLGDATEVAALPAGTAAVATGTIDNAVGGAAKAVKGADDSFLVEAFDEASAHINQIKNASNAAGTVDTAVSGTVKTSTSGLDNVDALRSEREALLNQKTYTAQEAQRIRDIDRKLADIKRAQLNAKNTSTVAGTIDNAASSAAKGADDSFLVEAFDEASEHINRIRNGTAKKSIFDMTPSKEWEIEHVHTGTAAGTIDNAASSAAKGADDSFLVEAFDEASEHINRIRNASTAAGTIDNASSGAAKAGSFFGRTKERVNATIDDINARISGKRLASASADLDDLLDNHGKISNALEQAKTKNAELKHSLESATNKMNSATTKAERQVAFKEVQSLNKEINYNENHITELRRMFNQSATRLENATVYEGIRMDANAEAVAKAALTKDDSLLTKTGRSIFDMTPSKEWELEHVHRAADLTDALPEGTTKGININEGTTKIEGTKIVPNAEEPKSLLTSEKLKRAETLIATKENGATKIEILEQDIKSLEAKSAGMNKFERTEINREIELKRSQIERLQRQVNTADAELTAELKDIDLDTTTKKALDLVAVKENGTTKIEMLEQDIKSLEAKSAGMNKFERAEINREIELKRSQIERLQRQVNTADAELKDIEVKQKMQSDTGSTPTKEQVIHEGEPKSQIENKPKTEADIEGGSSKEQVIPEGEHKSQIENKPKTEADIEGGSSKEQVIPEGEPKSQIENKPKTKAEIEGKSGNNIEGIPTKDSVNTTGGISPSNTSPNTDIAKYKNLDEYLTDLRAASNAESSITSDKKFISEYLESPQAGNRRGMYTDYSYNKDFNYKYVVENTFDDNGGGVQISGIEKRLSRDQLANRGMNDYRITLRTSDKITSNEAIAFINTFVDEANKRGLNLRAKNLWETDALILYCDKEDLLGTAKLLEDLKDASKYGELVSSATKHFGPRQPFSGALSEDAYYGISMAHSEPSITGYYKKTFGTGKPSATFNEYISDQMCDSYNALLTKYNGDAGKITVDEMYDEVLRRHKKYMLGDENASSDIPLWMNRRNYTEFNQSEVATVHSSNKINSGSSDTTTSTKVGSLETWEEKIYGGKLNRTPQGYSEAVEARNGLIKKQQEILDKIANGTATPSEVEYISSGRMAKQIDQKNRAVRAIEHTMNKPLDDKTIIESDRIFAAKNSVVSGDSTIMPIIKENSLHTNQQHVYRVTGHNQLEDIINTGYVRPRAGKAKGSGALNKVYWTSGSEKVNYDLSGGLSGKVILEVPAEKLTNGQIGAISIEDLSGIWKYDKATGKNINILEQIKKLYSNK